MRGALAPDALPERTGGWRGTGPFARVALFVLGCLAAGLLFGILGIKERMLLVAGVIATLAAEWLKQGKRLHASGIEEGLCLGGYLMIGLWIASQCDDVPGLKASDPYWIALIVATGAAGLRLLSPLLLASAAVACVDWLGSQQFAQAIDAAAGGRMTTLLLACIAAAAALAAGSRQFRRPSHDRALDWMVVVLPVLAYAGQAGTGWFVSAAGSLPGGAARATTCALLLALAAASLAAGLRRRRHAPLLAFLGCVACFAVELRFAVGGPAEAWLLLGGLSAIFAAAALDRYLQRPREGVTSAKLTDREGPLDLLQTVGASVLAQHGRTEPPPAVAAHEGRFGGGGASGSF
jgi:hypothetical protein